MSEHCNAQARGEEEAAVRLEKVARRRALATGSSIDPNSKDEKKELPPSRSAPRSRLQQLGGDGEWQCEGREVQMHGQQLTWEY